MTALSAAQIRQYASNAGFTGTNLNIMTAIAFAESGGNPSATNPNDNGGKQTSWGLWQISDGTHNAPAGWSDPQTNANLAFQKFQSQGLGAWGSYTNGSYLKFMTSSPSTQTQFPAYLQDLQSWVSNPSANPLFGRYQNFPEGGMEGGVDLGSPGGTPVYALATGPLQGAGYFCHGGPFMNSTAACGNGAPGYGVLTQRVNVPGYGLQDLYYQHIQLASNIPICGSGACSNYVVQQGQQIGTIIPGVNMLEMGFNAGGASSGPGGNGTSWGTIWGGAHPGAWVTDPRPMLQALVQGGGGNIPLSSQTGGVNTSTGCAWYDIPCWFQNQVEQVVISSGFVLFGLILLLVGILILFIGHGGSVEVAGTGVGVGQGGSQPG